MSLGSMNMRDYFIAHAPAKPPKWFNPDVPPCPAVPSITFAPECIKEQLLAYQDGALGFEQMSATAQAWFEDRDRIEKMQGEWQENFRVEFALQWPLYWADEMLKRRSA